MHISEQPDLEKLTPQEIGILNIIVDKFKDMSSAEISAMSHKEDAWKEYHDCDNLISYNEAFKLNNVYVMTDSFAPDINDGSKM